MTSRLKHKLELENVNLKSAYLNESFVQIGTPLPALAESKRDKQEYVPLWEQEVRDEKGRRRFHGAFTGGFSAGYFNTVGSKEGWTPQSFRSSRNNRASHSQRVEDFMDEEDLAQMNDDRQLQNTETFRNDPFAGTQSLEGQSMSSALESLVIPAQASIGQKLLQKLGWRPGQGIGPRLTLRKLRIQEGKLGKLRVGMDVDPEDGGEASKHTYAPRDTRLLTFSAKDDKEGLGYEKGRGMGRLPEKRGVYGAGPGEDDEDDPYGVGGADDARHYAFDNGEEEDDTFVMGGPTPQPESSKKSQADANHWHDGRRVLEGFELDPLGVPTDKWFAFPDIPEDWHPRPARVWGTTRKFDDSTAPIVEQEVVRGAPGRPLTHEQRGAALGEQARVSEAKSVFEYISEKDRERLAAFAAAAKAGTAPPPPLSLEAEPELPPERATEVVIPPLWPRTASAALQGFMPYQDEPEKQERYRSYLTSQTHNTKHPNPQLLPSTKLDAINKELQDFAQSARIFRPMSYAMSSRFTSGSASLAASDMKQAKPGLHIFDASKGASVTFAKPENTEIEVKKDLTPREQAAEDGKHGQLTRIVKDFYPVKLVCKRFHVADPHPEGPPEGSGASTPSGTRPLSELPLPKNDASFESRFTHQGEPSRDDSPPPPETTERVPRSIAEVGMADDANQGRDTLTYTKPSIDIFKAIFADDSEDDGEDEVSSKPAAKAVKVTVSEEKPKDPYPVVEEKPVDYNTFKPVFRSAAADDKDADKAAKKKDKKDKKKRKGVLSFDVGDEGEEAAPRDKPKKKSKLGRADADQGEWVEKAPVAAPLAVAPDVAAPADQLPASRSGSSSPTKGGPAYSFISRGRKGAADFM